MSATLASLQTLLPSDRFLTASSDLDYYGRDICKDFTSNAALIVLPRSIQEVQQVVKWCFENQVAIVPSGGRTGCSAGATATNGEIILSVEKLNRILEIDIEAQTITCEPGVTTETLIKAAADKGLFYGVDFASKGSSHIGGNIATNAGGIRVIRYGNTRDWVLGLKVVDGRGELIDISAPLIKNQTGYDLKHLFIGSEGTLGVIVEATLKLMPPPKSGTLLAGALHDLKEVLPTLKRIRELRLPVSMFEYFDPESLDLVIRHTDLRDPFSEKYPAYIVAEVETPSEEDVASLETLLMKLVEEGVLGDVVIAHTDKQWQEIIGLRERIPEVIGRHYIPHKNDVSVPVRSVPEFVTQLKEEVAVQYAGIKVLIFGHVGDGNLHVNVLKPEGVSSEDFFKDCHRSDESIFQIVQKFNGSISAEHGVGLLKKPFLHYSRDVAQISLMQCIKAVFDPKGILNPGKIFD